jgi:hypothetical protein
MKIFTLYKTIRETDAGHLDASVNAAIREGFQPFGSPYASGNFLCQAVIKISDSEAP